MDYHVVEASWSCVYCCWNNTRTYQTNGRTDRRTIKPIWTYYHS